MTDTKIIKSEEANPAPVKTIEEQHPLSEFHDTIHVLFKHTINGRPVSLLIRGGEATAEDIMKGGRHNLKSDNGHDIVFNGNDVLWAECFTATENRDMFLAQKRAQRDAEVAAEAQAKAESEAVKQARQEARAEVVKIVRDAAKTGRLGFVRASALDGIIGKA
jgi:hypothetical protein